MKLQTIQILAAREAGRVHRCHVLPGPGYDLAQHSYGALSLLLLLHPSPSLGLIKAVLWHDVAERWLGDLPQTAKMDNPELTAVYEAAENRILRKLAMFPELDAEEQRWLRAVDVVDFLLWCFEEVHTGNKYLEKVGDEVSYGVRKMMDRGRIPDPMVQWLEDLGKVSEPRLSNLFSDVVQAITVVEVLK